MMRINPSFTITLLLLALHSEEIRILAFQSSSSPIIKNHRHHPHRRRPFGVLGRNHATAEDQRNVKNQQEKEQQQISQPVPPPIGWEEEDTGFPAWVQGLGQWPLSPEPPSEKSKRRQRQQEQLQSSGFSSSSNPLANLLDLGALISSLAQGQRDPKQKAAINEEDYQQQHDTLLDGLYSLLSVEKILQASGTVLNISVIAQQLSLDQWVGGLHQVLEGDVLLDEAVNSTAVTIASSTTAAQKESMFRQATSQIEVFVNEASNLLLAPNAMRDFILQASQVLQNATKLVEQAAKDISVAEGVDGGEAERRVREALDFSANLVAVADAVLRKGYVAVVAPGNATITTSTAAAAITVTSANTMTKPTSTVPQPTAATTTTTAATASVLDNIVPPIRGSRALFADFPSVQEVGTVEFYEQLAEAAEMGALSAAIYEQTLPRTHALGHAIVAQGTTANIKWMVTDSITNDDSYYYDNSYATTKRDNATQHILLRTITIRGFDASDESVDREDLLVRVCTATPETLKGSNGGKTNNNINNNMVVPGNIANLEFHSGMLGIARDVYKDLKQYIQWSAPSHKIVLTGHSVGGSLSILVLLLMTLDLGAEYVRSKVLRVFTFGSPPVVRLAKRKKDKQDNQKRGSRFVYHCDVLEAFELPSTLVEGYVQPWDPIVRLFSEIDPFYPLLSDVGEDGVTPWVSGPPRTLRPITKAIMEAWDGWPRFRDSFSDQSYHSVGVQNILVPEPTRYLADRFVAVNIPVPPIEAILRISSRELLQALSVAFPLDVFEVSFVPQAIRSFVHHFYPAYGYPMIDYVKRLENRASPKRGDKKQQQPQLKTPSPLKNVNADMNTTRTSEALSDPIIDWGRAAQWFQRKQVP